MTRTRSKKKQSSEEPQKDSVDIIVENMDPQQVAKLLTVLQKKLGVIQEQPKGKKSGMARRVEGPEQRKVKRIGSTQQGGKKFARTEPIDLSGNRPNLFFERGLDKLHKDDVKIDKKLNKGKTRSERRPQAALVEVQCNRCKSWWEVPKSFILQTEEGITYICDDCSRKR